MNKAKFYDLIRDDLFEGKLTQSQVDGIETILAHIEDLNNQSQAYILATVFHETNRKMQPLSEIGKGKAYTYGKWYTNSKGVEYGYKNGKRNSVYLKSEYPFHYYGRGLVQLTWFDNYLYAETRLKELGLIEEHISFLKDPELLNDPVIAILVLKLGMVEGWFTTRKLEHYFKGSKIDYVNARKIVNGFDQAERIANYAEYFEKALRTK